MEKKQTVYFRFPAGSEGAESMKKLVEAITTCEDKAEELALEMGVTRYRTDELRTQAEVVRFQAGGCDQPEGRRIEVSARQAVSAQRGQ